MQARDQVIERRLADDRRTRSFMPSSAKLSEHLADGNASGMGARDHVGFAAGKPIRTE